MKRVLAIILAIAVAAGMVSGCSGRPRDDKNTLNVCFGSEPSTLDPALNASLDGANFIVHLFSGLARWETQSDGSYCIVPDGAEELVEGVENEDGTVTYTYTLRDGLKWSDGKDLTAYDYEYAWNRAASLELGADYGYMFEVVKGYDEMNAADDAGVRLYPDAKLAVQALDDKTLEVTLTNAVPYWDELLAFPTYFPVRSDVVSDENWTTSPSTYICNGPYKMQSWVHNSVITLVKNEYFIDAADITMGTINCYLSDDMNNMLINFMTGDWQFIDDVPTNDIANLKTNYKDEFFITGNLGTYYICWNVNENILPAGSPYANDEHAKEEIRRAVGLLFDRYYIVDQISQGGQIPASSFVATGLTDSDGKTDFVLNSGHSDEYNGYFDASAGAYGDNFKSAVEILKKYYTYDEASGKFTDFPTLTYLYNTNEGHKAVAEYLQSAASTVGITVNLENQEWNTFLDTRKSGNFSIARSGWSADYNDPISFLDMWISGSGNNDVQFGKGAHANVKAYSLDLTPYGYDIKVENGTWAETYDVLISTIKSCTDSDSRYKMMHLAEDMLMETGCVTPLYYYTELYMIQDNVEGYYCNPLGYKYFMYTTIK